MNRMTPALRTDLLAAIDREGWTEPEKEAARRSVLSVRTGTRLTPRRKAYDLVDYFGVWHLAR